MSHTVQCEHQTKFPGALIRTRQENDVHPCYYGTNILSIPASYSSSTLKFPPIEKEN